MTPPDEAASPPTFTSTDADLMLSVQGVSKHYKLWSSPTERLRYSVFSQAHRTLRAVLPRDSASLAGLRRRRDALSRDFTALHPLSFEVSRGESLGILGRNGAGKSTLLQLIAGTLRPSTGRVEVYGRTAALLELGSGFNMEYTGRENVYLNAATLGFSKAEVDAKFDEIAAFADIGQFLDQPVKTYSSGMLVRLAFSVQMAVEPDLFIIDEALAVGDVYFQSKCNKLLRRKLDDGLTLLLVSHNPASVRSLCQRGLVLNAGKQVFAGPSDAAVNAYHALGDHRQGGSNGNHVPAELPEGSGSALSIPQGLGRIQDEIGSREVVLTGCQMFDAAGKACREFSPGETIRVGFTLRARTDIGDALIGFAVRDRFNNVVAARTNINQGLGIPPLREGELFTVSLTFAGRLGPGEYLLDLGVGSAPDVAGSPGLYYHRVGGVASFGISWNRQDVTFQGICDVDGTFELPWATQDSGGTR